MFIASIVALGLIWPAFAGSILAENTTSSVHIPSDLSTRKLLPDVYGYSVEPIWVDAFIDTPLMANLTNQIGDITGVPPPIRIGGTTSDETYQYTTLPTENDSVALPSLPSATMLNVTPHWYVRWGEYYPKATKFIFAVNFAVNASNWANAVSQAQAAHAALGSSLEYFELGNEVDHYVSEHWRNSSWDVAEYVQQFDMLTDDILGSIWRKKATNGPKFQAGSFADPPWVPDQQVDQDDFDIINLTKALTQEDRSKIGTYCVHLYPQSTCDTGRWLRMRLDLLSDHEVLWLNVSQYVPQVAAADAAGAPLVMGETNSVSCSGRSGISDTFGAALWGVDYTLMLASVGIEKLNMHLGAESQYSSFTPLPYELNGEYLEAGIRAPWYGHYFIAQVVKGAGSSGYQIAALPDANSSDFSGYAIYGGKSLQKLVFLDMGVWNGTEGLSNPSTLSATDGTMFSEGTRPRRIVQVSTPWRAGREVQVTRLSGPGTNAKSNVTVSGVSFDTSTGARVGDAKEELVTISSGGLVQFDMERAEAVLIEIDSSNVWRRRSRD